MRAQYQISLLLIMMFLACDPYEDSPERKQWLSEIKAVEQEFNTMARDSGIAKAFGHFATENAVIKRGDMVIKGRDSIISYYQRGEGPIKSLEWKPSYIDVSDDGTLGYTYGKFNITSIDSTGTEQVQEGVFHTVWKRQEDGSWKYVWD